MDQRPILQLYAPPKDQIGIASRRSCRSWPFAAASFLIQSFYLCLFKPTPSYFGFSSGEAQASLLLSSPPPPTVRPKVYFLLLSRWKASFPSCTEPYCTTPMARKLLRGIHGSTSHPQLLTWDCLVTPAGFVTRRSTSFRPRPRRPRPLQLRRSRSRGGPPRPEWLKGSRRWSSPTPWLSWLDWKKVNACWLPSCLFLLLRVVSITTACEWLLWQALSLYLSPLCWNKAWISQGVNTINQW